MFQYRTRVAGTGSYLPEKTLSNVDLEKLVDTNDQWIRERTGIERRHLAAPDEATSDLGVEAAKRALIDAQMEAKYIDMIICATITGDHIMPSTACFIQQKLGLTHIPAFDLSAACSGFIYAMSIADQFIRNGVYKNILIIGAETIHRYIDYKDRETCILFGDAGGAFVLSRTHTEDPNVIKSTHLHAEGSLNDLLIVPGGGSRLPFSADVLENGHHFVKMKGREIFKNAVRTMSNCCAEALAANNTKPEEIDWLVPHQANTRIMEAVANHYNFPIEKVINIIADMGNTSAATVPVAFDLARKDGRIQRGQNILFTVFGAGLTSGSALLRF